MGGNSTPSNRKYWERYEQRYKVRESFGFRAKYSFVDRNGKRLPSTSKYMPHQGEREIARRLKRKGVI